MSKEREAFEAWVSSNGRSIERFSDGSYKSMTLDKEWEAWQAAKAQAALEGFVLVHKYHQENIKDALIIACDIKKDEQRFEDSLNYVHKAMIEAQESAND